MRRFYSIFFLIVASSLVAANCSSILTAQAADTATKTKTTTQTKEQTAEQKAAAEQAAEDKARTTQNCDTSATIEKESTQSKSKSIDPDQIDSSSATDQTSNEESASPTPSPLFEPDLGYEAIKECLPVSRLDHINGLTDLWNSFWTYSNMIVAMLALLGLVFSGLMFITAGSNPDRAKSGRNTIIAVITGIIIYMIALRLLSWIPGAIGGFFK